MARRPDDKRHPQCTSHRAFRIPRRLLPRHGALPDYQRQRLCGPGAEAPPCNQNWCPDLVYVSREVSLVIACPLGPFDSENASARTRRLKYIKIFSANRTMPRQHSALRSPPATDQ